MTDYAEKRDFLRMAIDCELTFYEQSESSQRYNGQVVNLSSKGILFTSEQSFEVGTTLEIVLTPSNTLTPPMQASVEVTRVSDNTTTYEMACVIDKIH